MKAVIIRFLDVDGNGNHSYEVRLPDGTCKIDPEKNRVVERLLPTFSFWNSDGRRETTEVEINEKTANSIREMRG